MRKHTSINTILLLGLMLILSGCAKKTETESSLEVDPLPETETETSPTATCESDSKLTTYCGFKNPEDLALTPDNNFLVVTGFGGIPDTVVGEMALFNLATLSRVEFNITLSANTWGDVNCKRSHLDFSPHGLDLVQREDGAHQLAITNHYPEETIEFFELVQKEKTWALEWRGCVAAQTNTMFNDVALTRGGAFYATEMYSADLPYEELVAAGAAIEDTGSVWHWDSKDGYSIVSGTAGSFPNGIALSEGEDYLYINYWFAGKTVKFNLESSTVEFEHKAGLSDNLANINGDIWVATHDMTLDQLAECPPTLAQCLIPFTIFKLSGNDLSEQAVYPFKSNVYGVATVAIPHNNNVWLGTFHGDRIASFELE